MNTTITVLGGMIGALVMINLIHKFSKFKVLICNLIVLIMGVSICLTGNIYAMVFGRLLWGSSFGIFSVVCSKYVNEFCPMELRGRYLGLD